MKLENGSVSPPFISETEYRPWGFYGLYSNNEPCTTKILYINRNQMLSLQYHFKRDQFYLMLDDNFIVEYSSKPVPNEILNERNEDWRVKSLNAFLDEHMIQVDASEGDMFGFKKKVIHRTTYSGPKNVGRVLDVAFGINDEEDIVRIKDKYGRVE